MQRKQEALFLRHAEWAENEGLRQWERRRRHSTLDSDDARQAGLTGCWKAVKSGNYDSRRASFYTFASLYIRTELNKMALRPMLIPRFTPVEAVADPDFPLEHLRHVPMIMRCLIWLRFVNGLTATEIGQRLGLSGRRVNMYLKCGLLICRHELLHVEAAAKKLEGGV